MTPLAPRYEPKEVEGRIYAAWMTAKAFAAEDPATSKKEPYVIAIPPPNVTGSLHLGHALNNTLQDILIRFERMRGRNACWIPGVDHAGLYTQVVVEKELKKEGLTRHDLGREKFLERVWEWKGKYGDRIVEQLKLMGCSCDWDRSRFTLDEGFTRATREHFARLYREGLIYRGERITNWCPRCRTALSDLEVKHQDRKGSLWHLRYPLKGGGEVILATTRPETLLGDTAVAVHPEDDRYRGLAGKTALLPLLDREIPVIADAYVDKAFGTGVVKITPGHDPNDFEIGARHKLPVINILNSDATLNEAAGPYAGLDRFKARERVLADLEDKGLLVKTEPYSNAVGHCERCGTMLEPMVTKQWYMKMRGLADEAMKAVEDKRVVLQPDNMPAIFNEWMRNIQDWCISRQTWWGHRIPVWTCAQGHHTVPGSGDAPDPIACATCGGPVTQDPDTLDTWFTSCLWPFGILGWPDEKVFAAAKSARLYPTTILVTGWDILFFWVSRMIMMGLHHTKEVPFRTVVLNSLVADPEGKKMSKSKGNVIDPLELFDKYGTDASRFALARLETLRETIRVSEERVEYGRNFMNKLWNAARFTLGELEGFTPAAQAPSTLSPADRWILGHAAYARESAIEMLEGYKFGEYALLTEEFVWHTLCDTYIELAKPALKDDTTKSAAQWTLWYVLDTTLHLMHPVVPFVTEEIWQRLPHLPGAARYLMLDSWPSHGFTDEHASDMVDPAVNVAETIRALKHEQGMSTGQVAEVAIQPADQKSADRLREALRLGYVQTLTRANVRLLENGEGPPTSSVSAVTFQCIVHLKLEAPADPAAERTRLAKEQDALQALLSKTRGALANQDYVAKAPPERVAETRRLAADYEARLGRLAERLRQLS